MKLKRTFHQLGNSTYDVDTEWVGRKQYFIHVEGVGDTWYLSFDGKCPSFSATEYKVIELLEQKGVLTKSQVAHVHDWVKCCDKVGNVICKKGY